MPLFETLVTTVGFAIAKSTLKLWLKDDKLFRDISSDLLSLIQSKFNDYKIQNAARRQFERIAEKAAESIAPIFEIEYRELDEGETNAAIMEVTSSINSTQIDPDHLAQLNIDPVQLSREIRSHTNLSTFSAAGADLIRQIADEGSQLIIDFAGNLPGFTERTLGEVLLRESVIMENIDSVIVELARMRESSTFVSPHTAQARFEEAYRRQVSRKLDEIELFGAGESIAQSSRRHNLTLAYISLRVQRQGRATPRTGQGTDSDRLFQTAPGPQSSAVDAAILAAQRIVIRGEAGSGKTTLYNISPSVQQQHRAKEY
jgi:ABC-type multidrug transport system fused ATPase/permease subunit